MTIQSKVPSKEFYEHYERIFGKKNSGKGSAQKAEIGKSRSAPSPEQKKKDK